MGSGVELEKFVWNREGYKELLDSDAVQAIVQEKADEVASSANAMMPPDSYRLPAHEVKVFEGRLAIGRVVRTKTDNARRETAKNNLLKKALDGIGG